LVGDPFVRQFGVQATVAIPRAAHYGAMLGTGVYFNHGESSWKPLTKQLVEENKISPDISTLVFSGYGALYVEPAHFSQGEFSSAVGAYAGIGFAATEDDLVALGDDSPEARATAEQIHPAGVFGLYADLQFSSSGRLRFRAHNVAYVEAIASKTLEKKNLLFLGVEYGFVFAEGRGR
jgi:hypothetical protein